MCPKCIFYWAQIPYYTFKILIIENTEHFGFAIFFVCCYQFFNGDIKTFIQIYFSLYRTNLHQEK